MRSATGIAMKHLMPLGTLLAAALCGPLGGTQPAFAQREVPNPVLASTGEAAARPNVIWILLDACRADHLSCYGYGRATSPHLDELAARGILFEQNFSQANNTTLSVASYMSGKFFPVYCLGRGAWQAMFRTPPNDEVLLPIVFSQNGYATVCITAHPWFSPESRICEAFDEVVFVKPQRREAYANLAMLNEAIFSWLERRGDAAFFLYVHALDTHAPHDPNPPYDQWLSHEYRQQRREDPALRRPPFSGRERAYLCGEYDGDIRYSDDRVKELTDRLAVLGLLDNTVIIVGADHGELLGEDGETVGHPSRVNGRELFHVPLIMAGPGLPKGRRVQELTQNVDIYPTLVGLLGLETHARVDGRSLAPLLGGSPRPVHDYVMGKIPVGDDDCMARMLVRDKHHHYDVTVQHHAVRLFDATDGIASQVDCAEDKPDVIQRMHAFVETELVPRWKAYAALPRNNVGMFTCNLQRNGKPSYVWVDSLQATATDNKWSLVTGRLKSCGYGEDAPPITFDIEVPNGRWKVELEAEATTANPDNIVGTAFAVRAEGDTDSKCVATDDPSSKTQFVEIGVYDIQDGVFTVTLDEGSTQRWAVASGFRFIPADNNVNDRALSEQEDRDEQLRALGYLE